MHLFPLDFSSSEFRPNPIQVGLHPTKLSPPLRQAKNCFSFDSLRSLASKIGWVRPRGKRGHGCFRRTELDRETNETKLVTHSFVLGSETEMSKSQAREKLEDEITKLGGRSTGDQSVVNGAPFEEAALHQ